MSPLFAFSLGPAELIVIAVIGILLFGRRLPEVGRSIGKGIVEFKKGIKGLEDDVDGGYNTNQAPAPPPEAPRPPQRITSAAPKFDEPPNPSAPPRI